MVDWRYSCNIVQMTQAVTIRFFEFGIHLGTRVEGQIIREKILSHLLEGHKVTFDLKGVEVVSNSFADECFAKLTLNFELPTIKSMTHFQNVSDFNRAVIANSFRERLIQAHTS